MVHMKEEWKTIPRNKNYEASSLGRIKRICGAKSYDGIRTYTGEKILSPAVQSNGRYNYVALSGNGPKAKYFLVHRLVAEAFLPNPNDLPCVHHKDRNVFNNCATNLEWVSNKDNLQYARNEGRIYTHPRGAPSPNRKLDADGVRNIRNLRKRGVPVSKISKMVNIAENSIYRICSRKYYPDVP